MNKIINSVLMSVISLSVLTGTAYAEYYTQTLNMGGDPIQPTQTIVTPSYQSYTPSSTERKTYTGSIIQQSVPEPSKVYVPVYQPYPYNNYITTYSVVPYYRGPYYPPNPLPPYSPSNRTPYYNPGISVGLNTGINTGTGSFAYNYQGHGFDYGFSSGRPLYVNRPGMQPPPPPPNHNYKRHDRNGAEREIAK